MAVDFETDSAQYLFFGSDPSLDSHTSFSVSAWIWPESFNFQRLFQKDDNAGGVGWLVNWQNAGVVALFRKWSGSLAQWDSDNVFNTTSWQHVGITYVGTIGADAVFYRNGVLLGTNEQTAPSGTIGDDAASNMVIGAAAQSYDGLMEEFRYASVIWTPEEMALLATGYRGPMRGEVCHVDLMLPRGTNSGALTFQTHVFNDLSGNGNDGDPFNEPVLIAGSTCPRIGVLI